MRKFHFKSRRFCAVLIGLVFFLAGVSKLGDPVGGMLKVREYLNFFHLGFLRELSMPIAVGLALLEALSGVALVTGVYRVIAAVVAWSMTAVFTVITFILWLKNPEMDCGCFGEVVHLDHKATLLKNLVLLALCFIAFMPFKEFGRQKVDKAVSFWIVVTAVLAFTLYPLLYRPMIDFTAYRPEARLAAAGGGELPPAEFVTRFIYEKDGARRSFGLDELPDSTWTFVDTQVERLGGESEDPELALRDAEGAYADSVAVEGKVMVFSVWKPSAKGLWERLETAVADAADAGMRPVIALAYVPENYPDALTPYTYTSDYKTLISLNRSNGGPAYFFDGTLIRKWALRNMPSGEQMQETAAKDPTDAMLSGTTMRSVSVQAFLLFCLAVMVLV